jgi:dihydroneopterin aldolase
VNTTLRIQGLEIYAHHGLFAEERALGQRFCFDVSATLLPGRTHTSDDLSNSIDYGAIAERVAALVTSSRLHTLEALAQTIACDLLMRFSEIESVRLSAAKTAPPLALRVAAVGVEFELRRRDLGAI